jgi:hypothetical protein
VDIFNNSLHLNSINFRFSAFCVCCSLRYASQLCNACDEPRHARHRFSLAAHFQSDLPGKLFSCKRRLSTVTIFSTYFLCHKTVINLGDIDFSLQFSLLFFSYAGDNSVEKFDQIQILSFAFPGPGVILSRSIAVHDIFCVCSEMASRGSGIVFLVRTQR